MKDKHIHVPDDSELLKAIHARIARENFSGRRYHYPLIIGKFLVYFSFAGILYRLLFLATDPLVFILCYVLFGWAVLLFAFNFAHDFSHNTVFKSKQWNSLGFILSYTLVGAHAEAWRQRHIHSHHYAPNVEDYDSDLKISSLIRVIPGSKFRWYHRYQHFYAPLAYTSYSLFWIFVKDFILLFSPDDVVKEKGARYQLSFWGQKSFYLAYLLLLPLLFSQQPAHVVIAGFIAMHLSQSLFLLFTFFMTHHVETTAYPVTDSEGYIKASWLMNQVTSSNDMHPFSYTANFIFGGFNNHIAHHLFPHVHHIYYPRLSRILYRMLAKKGIVPNQTSYWGGIVSHLKLLKKMAGNNVTGSLNFSAS